MLSHLPSVYRPNFGLLTDLYQLTMAYAYYRKGLHHRKSIFHLYYRKPPFGGQLAVAAGLALAVDMIRQWQFSAEDVQYLGRLTGDQDKPLFNEAFLHYLQRLRFSGDILALAEGEIVFPNEPLLRIEANLVEAQLLETALLNIINFSTLIATKAARIKAVAGPNEAVVEFGLRRAQGIDGGLTASRSAYLGGCDGTSNVWAGRYYQIPVKGTHAHSWVMVFPDELAAFEAYAEVLPHNSTLLVDTYDTLEGTKKAIQVAYQLRAKGHRLLGIRLDSGDLAALAKGARQLLDEAGLEDVAIVASNDLDEARIKALKAQGAPITVWGIGTRLVTAYDQAALGGVYKLAAIQDEAGNWQAKIKGSEQAIKTSLPGKLQIRRYFNGQGQPLASQLYNEWQGEPTAALAQENRPNGNPIIAASHRDLLQPIFLGGALVAQLPSLKESRQLAMKNYSRYEANDWQDKHGNSPSLEKQKLELIRSFQRLGAKP